MAEDLPILPGSMRTEQVEVTANGSPSTATIRQLRVDLGSMLLADVVFVHEPRTGMVWWNVQTAGYETPQDRIESFRDSWKAVADSSRIVAFRYFTPEVWARESSLRATSIDEAQSMVLAQVASAAPSIRNGTLVLVRQIGLGDALDAEFNGIHGAGPGGPMPRVTGVTRGRGDWQVEIQSRRTGGSATVTLNDTYRPVHIVRSR